MASEIFESMEKEGTLGEFFPAKLNPFYFNDTVAGLIGGFKKEEVVKEGFMWRDEEIKVDIPDEKGNYYRIVKIEYDFLVKHGLPLPRLHWLDRMKVNFEVLKKQLKNELPPKK